MAAITMDVSVRFRNVWLVHIAKLHRRLRWLVRFVTLEVTTGRTVTRHRFDVEDDRVVWLKEST
jgi:hypothetical protein